MIDIEKENSKLKDLGLDTIILLSIIDSEDIKVQVYFYIIGEDYDYTEAFTVWKPNNELNQKVYDNIVERYSQDYIRTEHDCNGSAEVKFRQEFTEDKKFFRIRYSKHIDV